MTRCEEGVFYRVFCVSLLIIAFTFTVILTNVFVDIDNILSRKEREPTEKVTEIDLSTGGYETSTEIPEYYIGRERNNDADAYRTKRSLDSRNYLHIDTPKTKSYLTNRLAALLESLDEGPENTTPRDNGNIYIKTVKQKNNIEINELRPEPIQKPEPVRTDEAVLHLAMHNTLLQGIIGRMDMNQVYKNLQTLVSSFKYEQGEKDVKNAGRYEEFYTETTTQRKTNLIQEQNLIEELLKYKMREQDSRDSFDKNEPSDTNEDEIKKDKPIFHSKNKNANYVIKTLIDIKKDKNVNSKENFQGIIRLIYNGKPIKIRGEEDEITTMKIITLNQTTEKTRITQTTKHTLNTDVNDFANLLKDNFKNRNMPDSYLKTVLQEYLKKFTDSNESSTITLENQQARIKRYVDSDEKQTETPQTKDDDELFVEIETHFDKKGLNGEKKRKIISNLIEKIQNAIIPNPDNEHIDKDQSEPPIQKRVQNRLNRGTAQNYLFNTIPPSSTNYRNIDPLSKSLPVLEPLPFIADQNGEHWMQRYDEPKFLSTSKSINSAEMSLVDVDYNKNIKEVIIPQRVQVPLTTDSSAEVLNTVDLGNLQLLIKDIEGSGFSIGYNQYVDQAPDPESIKLFHGIEHVVNEYHQKHDQPDQPANHEYEMYGQEMKKREVRCSEMPFNTNKFDVNKRNVKLSDYKINDSHTNKHEYIYNENSRSYNTHRETYSIHEKNAKDRLKIKGNSSSKNGFRKKRSLKINKIVNIKKKIQINKFLNTNTIPRQWRNIKKVKSNKSQINNMKFISKSEEASENNNNMLIGSNGDLYNNNRIVRHRRTPRLMFGVIQDEEDSNRKPFLMSKPFFVPNDRPHTFEMTNNYDRKPFFDKNTLKYFRKDQEKKAKYKRQVHKIRIIARDMGHKNSKEKLITQYDEDMLTQLDGPQIVVSDNKGQHIEYENDNVDSEPFLYRNPFNIKNDEHDIFENNNPVIFNHDKHVFNFEPVAGQLRDNPLMLKYPHIFLEDRTSIERPEGKHFHREITKYESKESGISSDREVVKPAPQVEDLINAVVPSQRDHYKVSVKLIPLNNDNDNDTKPSFKEIHTSINKTFNKNGILYSSLVNVSEISKIEIANDTNMNTTHFCSQHLKSTTPANMIETVKFKGKAHIPKGSDNIFMTSRQLALNNERNHILHIIKKKPSETTTQTSIQMNLMDIILPLSPPKVFHLTVADVGQLICNAIKQDAKMTTTATMEQNTPKTTVRTTMSTTETVMATTTKPETHLTYAPQTVEPFKFKLLKAISLNEQLTSQILDKINQNTDILQTFLTKVSREIAKLPKDANYTEIKKDNVENASPDLSNPYINRTEVVPTPYLNPQAKLPLNMPMATKLDQNLIQVSPLIKNLRFNGNHSDDTRQWVSTKYFIDDDLKKTLSQQTITGTDLHNVPTDTRVDKTRLKCLIKTMKENNTNFGDIFRIFIINKFLYNVDPTKLGNDKEIPTSVEFKQKETIRSTDSTMAVKKDIEIITTTMKSKRIPTITNKVTKHFAASNEFNKNFAESLTTNLAKLLKKNCNGKITYNRTNDNKNLKTLYSKEMREHIERKVNDLMKNLQSSSILRKLYKKETNSRMKRKDLPKEGFVDFLVRNLKSFLHFFQRDIIDNLKPVTKRFPPEMIAKDFNRKLRSGPDPKAFYIIEQTFRLLREQVHGIQLKYDNLTPKYGVYKMPNLKFPESNTEDSVRPKWK